MEANKLRAKKERKLRASKMEEMLRKNNGSRVFNKNL